MARYGGEEFAVVIEGGSPDARLRTIDFMRQAIGSSPIAIGARSLSVTATAGVSDCRDANDVAAWVGLADEALYAGKKLGRNRTVVRQDGRCVPFVLDDGRAAAADPDDVDAISGLSNKKAFLAELHRTLAALKREPRPTALIRVDLADYDRLLNAKGFRAAEAALQRAAAILRAELRDMDHAGRIGQASFAILLRDLDDSRATVVLERLQLAFQKELPGVLVAQRQLDPTTDVDGNLCSCVPTSIPVPPSSS